MDTLSNYMSSWDSLRWLKHIYSWEKSMHQLRAGESHRISTTFLKLKGFIWTTWHRIPNQQNPDVFLVGILRRIAKHKSPKNWQQRRSQGPMEKPHGDPPTQLDSVHKNTDVTKMIFRGGTQHKNTKKCSPTRLLFSLLFSLLLLCLFRIC